jgi:predicted nucleotidyltransferase
MGKYDKYIEAWLVRLAKEQDEQNRRIDEMHRIAARCAEHLARHFDVKRVYFFGSLESEKFIHARSDIDLAVEGLASHLYFKALSALWDELPPGVELDLVPLEDAYDSLKEKIKTQGKLLYERK